MLLFALICLLLFLLSIGYILWQRRQYHASYMKFNDFISNAIEGSTEPIKYDETLLSALEVKFLRYVNVNRERLAGIQDDRDKIKTLISDISHQTKTPIANILLYSGLLLENKSLDNTAVQLAGDIGLQSEKLNFLIGALVKMSRLETGIIIPDPKHQPVKPLLSAVVSDAYPKLEAKNMVVTVSCADDIHAKYDAKWTKESISNILENAIKYSEDGQDIGIRVIAYDTFIRIDITDNGIGIDESEINDIFKRFYRSPRTREHDGVGIGLYLAREIITIQGGYIKVSSQPQKGSTFSVFLPQK